MNAEAFVALLEKTRKTGPSRWIACCPAHPDKFPSLGIAEGNDGRTLVHCFAGCSVEEIVNALGLALSDIMPARGAQHSYKGIRKPFPAADVLEMLRNETMIVWLAGCDMAKGKSLSFEERQRLDTAAARIEVACG